jgi:hypothetical protein
MEHHGDDVCGGSCVDARQNLSTIPTVGNLQGKSFLFPPKSLWEKINPWKQHKDMYIYI